MKTKDKYEWVIGSPPPPIDQHSLVKHQLIRDYVLRYIDVVMSNATIPKLKLTLVDGFAGGGDYMKDSGIIHGSPKILIDATIEAEFRLNVARKNPRSVDAEFHFIELQADSYRYLNHSLRQTHDHIMGQEKIHLHQGKFDHFVDPIIAAIKRRQGGERAIFILDQYAYKDVPFSSVRRIFEEVDKAEVILTFNVDSLMTYISDKKNVRTSMANIDLAEYIEWDRFEDLRRNNLFKPLIQEQLSNAILKASGARFMTMFYVKPEEANSWGYWLIHLSKTFRARDVMMQLHWDYGNSFGHTLSPGLFHIAYEAKFDTIFKDQASLGLGEAHTFDGHLNDQCIKELSELAPKILYDKDGTTFGGFMHEIANQTTATSDFVRLALNEAVQCGDLVVKGENGETRKKGSSIRESDLILRNAQTSLFLVKSPTS